MIMEMMSIPIDEQVLNFYKTLPFNFKGSIENHALGVMKRKSYGENLEPLLNKGTKVLSFFYSIVFPCDFKNEKF